MVLALVSSPAFAQVSISIDVAPPPLIVEEQPPIPDDGYIWTPGYWAYDQDQGAYYWVSGAWVQPPQPDVYWTPAYWGWDNDAYVYYPGYWGPTVGFYGGINYGYGYWGNGYGGGRWDNGHFDYNTAANNVSGGRVHNTYADRSAVRSQSSRVSFNGGKGGIQAQPTAQERQASQQGHIQPTTQQQARFQEAAQTRSHQVKAHAHNPATAKAPQPGASQFTGQNAPEQRRDTGTITPPAQREHEVSPNTQPRTEQPMSPQVSPEVRSSPAIEQRTAPPTESHIPQGPGGAAVPSARPAGGPAPASHPQSQPQAQPHPEAKPQGGGQPAGGGQAKP